MKNLTDITIILDRSGSMNSLKETTISAFNNFITDQKKDGLPTQLSFVQFDDQYEVNYTAKDIHLAKELNAKTFVPRGMTALLDAIGRTVRSTKKRIKNKSKKERPDNVIIAIITDGYENASREYTREKIFKMIRKREEKGNWQFIFLAANQDAIAEGARFGIHQDRAITYGTDEIRVQNAYASLSKNIYNLKSQKVSEFKFSDEDRLEQEEDFFKNIKNSQKN